MRTIMVLLCLLICQFSYAGVEVPGEVKYGEPIVAKLIIEDLLEGAVIKGDVFPRIPGAKWLPGPTPDVFHIWAKARKEPYKIEVLGMWGLPHPETSGLWLDFGFFRYDLAEFTVIDGEEPASPDPPENPPTDPPQPPSSSPDLKAYFRDWADTVRNDLGGLIKDTDQWRTAFERASALLIGGTDYVAVEDRTERIEFILAESIGIENKSITEALRIKLADALQRIGETVITKSNAIDANYRPLISILTGLAITPAGVGLPVSAVVATKQETVGVKWVSHAEAKRRSEQGEWVWVQLSMTGCGPCDRLMREIFPAMKPPKGFVCMKQKDQGDSWGVRVFPTSVLVAPNWTIHHSETTPSSVAGVEAMLEKWKELR